jgi:hypothetical protein
MTLDCGYREGEISGGDAQILISGRGTPQEEIKSTNVPVSTAV